MLCVCVCVGCLNVAYFSNGKVFLEKFSCWLFPDQPTIDVQKWINLSESATNKWMIVLISITISTKQKHNGDEWRDSAILLNRLAFIIIIHYAQFKIWFLFKISNLWMICTIWIPTLPLRNGIFKFIIGFRFEWDF